MGQLRIVPGVLRSHAGRFGSLATGIRPLEDLDGYRALRAAATPRETAELRRTAFHEAGHALGDLLDGRRLRHVVVAPLVDAGGRLRTVVGVCRCHTGRPSPRALMCGPAAEAQAGLGIDSAPWSGPWAGDLGDLRSMGAGRRDLWHDVTVDLQAARRTMERHWPSVVDLAESLVDRLEVPGEEAEALLLARMTPDDRRLVHRVREAVQARGVAA